MAKLSFMNVIFEYKASDLTQYYRIQYFDKNNREIKNPKIPYGLKASGIIVENEFWPKGWETKGLLHKASAFSPKDNEFMYYYYIKETRYLITNRLSKDNWTHSWRYSIKNITDYADAITAFWSIKTEQIYFSFEKRKGKSRIGRIYFLKTINPKNNSREWYWFPVSTLLHIL